LPAIQAEARTLQRFIYIGDGDRPQELQDYEALIEKHEPIPDIRAHGDDLAGVFYTGGTTGFPKGVMLSHQSRVAGALNRLALGFPVGPVYLHAAPVFHLAGALGMFWQLVAGGTHVFVPSFTPTAFMEAVQKERVTDSLIVPTMIQMILDSPER